MEKFKRGSALLIAILTMTSILVMVLGVSRLVVPHIRQNKALTDALVADYAAKAGLAYFKANAALFNDGLDRTINLDGVGNCTNKDRCFKIEPVLEDNPGSGNKFRVAVVTLHNNQPLINQGLFIVLNDILTKGNDLVDRTLSSADYRFINPHSDLATISCNISNDNKFPEQNNVNWVIPLDILLKNPKKLRDYDLLYITNGTKNLQGNSTGNQGVLDFTEYFRRQDPDNPNAGGYKTTLADYLRAGGRIFIDNAHGANVIFPEKSKLQEWYPASEGWGDTGIWNVGFNWSLDATEKYPPDYTVSFYNKGYDLGGNDDLGYKGEDTIFKYLARYAIEKGGGMTLEKAMSKMQDTGMNVTGFHYLDGDGGHTETLFTKPHKVENGYVEMLRYVNPNRVNMAMQYFGNEIKGWILLTSSGVGVRATRPGGGGQPAIDRCATNASNEDDSIAAYVFIVGIAEFGSKLKTVKITGTYGGIQRTYMAVPEVKDGKLVVEWKEVPY
jgi:hypothetical protein